MHWLGGNMEKYNKLKETLNHEQIKLLVALDDENLERQIAQYDKGFADGKKHGLKTAVKTILGAM